MSDNANDQDLASELNSQFQTFTQNVDALETESLLSGPYDRLNCYLSLNAGAGGVDAQDWTQLLFRMYSRFAERQGFTVTLIDQSLGEEAGLKSATLKIDGEFAYGFLKNEIGVHRLVRLSPFNANNKRQTSFAGLEVIPELDDNFTIDLDPKDLRIDTFRASGAGGQHINKTDSAVRITHIPTGIVTQCQNERSQISNKDVAMTMLKSRLLVLMESQHKEKINEIRGDIKENAWGNQIRSYVFHPYKLVKDLRTQFETSDVQSVMDGDVMPFIQAHLRVDVTKEKS